MIEVVPVPDRLGVCEDVILEVGVQVGVIGGETLLLVVLVIVKELVVVNDPVCVPVRVCVGVCVPDTLPVAEEVDVIVAEGLGSTEGVIDCVWKEVVVGLTVPDCDPVPVLDLVRLAEAV